MKLRLIVVGLGLFFCQPTEAASLQADPVRDFIQLCGETQGTGATAFALADSTGWTLPPSRMHPPPRFDSGISKLSIQYRMKTVPGGLFLLGIGTAAGNAGVPMRMCSIASYPTTHVEDALDFATLRQELNGWAGVPPLAKRNAPQFVMFVFKAGPQGHFPLPQSVDPLAIDGPWPDGAVVVTLTSVDKVDAAGPFRIVSYTTAGP